MTSSYIIPKERSQVMQYVSTAMCLLVLCLSTEGCSDRARPTSVSATDLAAINEILAAQVRFDRGDFNDPHRVVTLLHVVANAHYRGSHLIGSSASLGTMGNLSNWLRGKEKNEAVLRQLCQDPQFKFEGNRWNVVFNVFRSDGGVDQCSAVGEYDPHAKTNRIENMESRQMKPKGTFLYPLLG